MAYCRAETLRRLRCRCRVDPVTGKPFRLQKVTGSAAHLRGSPPAGQEKVPPFNIHYVVTLQ